MSSLPGQTRARMLKFSGFIPGASPELCSPTRWPLAKLSHRPPLCERRNSIEFGRRAGRFQNGELVRLPFKQQRADAPWIAARAFQCALAAIVSVSSGAYGLEQEVSRSDPFCLLRPLRSAILSFADRASSRSKSRLARLAQGRKFRVTYDSN